MRNIVICDDEPEVCADLRSAVKRLSEELGEPMRLRICRSGEELLACRLEEADILLLDIKMREVSGLDAARVLRQAGNQVCIIFITSMTQYAMDGYEVHAFGFLRKPVQYERFRHVMTEALQTVSARRKLTVTLRRGTAIREVSAAQIQYIEARGHELRVVTEEEELLTGQALSELEEQLEGYGFFRCHKGFLVNFAHVRQIEQRDILMQNGGRIPLSKYRRREFLERFAQFAGAQL